MASIISLLTTVNFGCGDTASFLVNKGGGTHVFTFPEGVVGSFESDGAYSNPLEVVNAALSNTLVYIKKQPGVGEGVITYLYSYADEGGTETDTYYIKMNIACQDFSIVSINGGYKDFYKKTSETVEIDTYVQDDTAAPSPYYYYEDSGEFLLADNGTPKYSKISRTDSIQRSSDIFPAHFETVNLVFEDEAVNSGNLSVNIVLSTSMANALVRWATSSNSVFNGQPKVVALSKDDEETGAWTNSEVRYRGKKQLIVKDIYPLSRNSNAIKYKVDAVLTSDTLDIFEVHYIQVLPDGSLYIGDDNG